MSTITLSFLTLPLLSDTFSFLPSCFVTPSEKLKATLPCCSVFLRQSCAEGVGEGLDAATLAVLDALLDALRGVRVRRHWPLLAPQSSFRLLLARLLVSINMSLAHTTLARQRSWPDTQLHASVWVAPCSETVSSFSGLGVRELVFAFHLEIEDLVLGVDTASVTPCPSSCSPHYVSELCTSLCLLPETTVIRIGASAFLSFHA